MSTDEILSQASRINAVNTPNGVVLVAQAGFSSSLTTSSPRVSLPSGLMQERDRLRKDNQEGKLKLKRLRDDNGEQKLKLQRLMNGNGEQRASLADNGKSKASLAELIQERDGLRKENAELKRRLDQLLIHRQAIQERDKLRKENEDIQHLERILQQEKELLGSLMETLGVKIK